MYILLFASCLLDIFMSVKFIINLGLHIYINIYVYTYICIFTYFCLFTFRKPMVKHLPELHSYKIFPLNSHELPYKVDMWQHLRGLYFRFFRNGCYMLIFLKLGSFLFLPTALAQNFILSHLQKITPSFPYYIYLL